MHNKSLYHNVALLSLFLFLASCAVTSTDGRSRIIDLGNGICQDTKTGTMWQKEHTEVMFKLDMVQEYVGNLTLGGHSDWRLPTLDEIDDLNFIYDLYKVNGCPIERQGNYWAYQNFVGDTSGVWESVDLCKCGPERQAFLCSSGRVRLIRP